MIWMLSERLRSEVVEAVDYCSFPSAFRMCGRGDVSGNQSLKAIAPWWMRRLNPLSVEQPLLLALARNGVSAGW